MEDELLKQAQLGIEAEAFAVSDIGKYLISRANEELDVAREKLTDVLPTDTDAIIQWQQQAKTAIHFKTWLLQAISDGHYAERELNNE